MPEQATASDLPFYDILAPQKVTLSKIFETSLHVIRGLGALPIKNPRYAGVDSHIQKSFERKSYLDLTNKTLTLNGFPA